MESHAKCFVPTESNDVIFFNIFFLWEVFLWMDDNPQNFHSILLFDLQCWIFYLSKEQDMPNRDVIKKLPPDQRSSANVSPPPQQLPQQTESGTARRRKRTRALKDKTYMNDEGFMGTWARISHVLMTERSRLITITTSVSVLPSVRLFVYLCVLLPVYWLVCFSVLLTSFVWLSNCLYLCTSFSLHSCPLLCFVCMFSFRLPDHLSVSPSVGPSPRLSASPCIH